MLSTGRAVNCFRCHSLHWEAAHIVHNGPVSRALTAAERDRITGFNSNHTSRMCDGRAPKEEQNPLESTRCVALGDSFPVFVIARLLASFCGKPGSSCTKKKSEAGEDMAIAANDPRLGQSPVRQVETELRAVLARRG